MATETKGQVTQDNNHCTLIRFGSKQQAYHFDTNVVGIAKYLINNCRKTADVGAKSATYDARAKGLNHGRRQKGAVPPTFEHFHPPPNQREFDMF